MEFESRNLGFLGIFCSTLTDMTDEMEIVLLRFRLRNAQACAMLPDIALLASDAVRAIIL